MNNLQRKILRFGSCSIISIILLTIFVLISVTATNTIHYSDNYCYTKADESNSVKCGSWYLYVYHRSNEIMESMIQFDKVINNTKTKDVWLNIKLDWVKNIDDNYNLSITYCNTSFDNNTLTWNKWYGTDRNCKKPAVIEKNTTYFSNNETWYNFNITNLYKEANDTFVIFLNATNKDESSPYTYTRFYSDFGRTANAYYINITQTTSYINITSPLNNTVSNNSLQINFSITNTSGSTSCYVNLNGYRNPDFNVQNNTKYSVQFSDTYLDGTYLWEIVCQNGYGNISSGLMNYTKYSNNWFRINFTKSTDMEIIHEDQQKPLNVSILSSRTYYDMYYAAYPKKGDRYNRTTALGDKYLAEYSGTVYTRFNDNKQFFEFVNDKTSRSNREFLLYNSNDMNKNITIKVMDPAQQVLGENLEVSLYFINSTSNTTSLISTRLTDKNGKVSFWYWYDTDDYFLIALEDTHKYDCGSGILIYQTMFSYLWPLGLNKELICSDRVKELIAFDRTSVWVTPSPYIKNSSKTINIIVSNEYYNGKKIELRSGTLILDNSYTGLLSYSFEPDTNAYIPTNNDFNLSVYIDNNFARNLEFYYIGNETRYFDITSFINRSQKDDYYISIILFLAMVIIAGIISTQTSPNEMGYWVFTMLTSVLILFNIYLVILPLLLFLPLIWSTLKNILDSHEKLKVIVPIILIIIVMDLVAIGSALDIYEDSWYGSSFAEIIEDDVGNLADGSMIEKPTTVTYATDIFSNIYGIAKTMLKISFSLLMPQLTGFTIEYESRFIAAINWVVLIFMTIINVIGIYTIYDTLLRK